MVGNFANEEVLLLQGVAASEMPCSAGLRWKNLGIFWEFLCQEGVAKSGLRVNHVSFNDDLAVTDARSEIRRQRNLKYKGEGISRLGPVKMLDCRTAQSR
jgi:hypothetical protein